jgi:predicted lipoprotein with Yx(FWY)xxD motif
MRATTGIVAIGSLAAVTAGVSAAQAAPAPMQPKKVQVVKVVSTKHFGKILSKKATGRSLYYMPTGSCTGPCLPIWPPMLLPKGSTFKPTGVSCLGTANFAGRRQVTYRGHRLYTFADDTGSTPTGNGEGGFLVAKVKTGAC